MANGEVGEGEQELVGVDRFGADRLADLERGLGEGNDRSQSAAPAAASGSRPARLAREDFGE
jgi:hypothetical protein